MTGLLKCVVWDLDGTLWPGTLLEDGDVALHPGARRTLETLDARGILQSIASRSDEATALAHLQREGVGELFLHPRVGWGPKSGAVREIAAALGVGLDAMALVDDDPAERLEVRRALPDVRVYPAEMLLRLPDLPELSPPVVTGEARRRRLLYRADEVRRRHEEEFTGPSAEFLASLDLVLTVRRARGADDLRRAEELTVRTHQLNTTGRACSFDELARLATSAAHMVLLGSLRDRFGDYGTVALALVETAAPDWRLRLLIASCRVLSRGAGGAMLGHVMGLARAAGARLRADFVPNESNRMMLVTLRLAGFQPAADEPGSMVLEPAGRAPGAGHCRVVVADVR